MDDLPESWIAQPQRIVPADAPRPTMVWLAARVVSLLSHYYQPDDADEVFELMVQDWKDGLADLPKQALEAAFRDRLRANDRRRPIIGEIRERALAYTIHSRPTLAIDNGRPLYAPDPEHRQVTPERAAEILAEHEAKHGESKIGRRITAGWGDPRKPADGDR